MNLISNLISFLRKDSEAKWLLMGSLAGFTMLYAISWQAESDTKLLREQPQSWTEVVGIKIDCKPDGTPSAFRREHDQPFGTVRDVEGRQTRIGDGNTLVRGITTAGKELYWLWFADGTTRQVVIN